MSPLRSHLTALAIALAVVGSACSGDDPIELTERGQTYELAVGDEFEIVLRENVTVGESWRVVAINDTIVAPVGSKRHRHDTDLDGSSGVSTFRFEAVSSGTTRIGLEQDFQREGIIDRLQVTVVVDP